MRTVNDTLQYTDGATGNVHNVQYEYPVYESIEDAINELTEDEALRTLNRMAKVDARNTASAKAQAEAGHNQRTLSPEQKAANKQKAKADRDLLAKIKANPDLLAQLGM